MAYYERNHPKITEVELEFTTENERTAFDTLKNDLNSLPDKPYADVTDYTLFRFLRFASFDAAKASQNFQAYVKWRTDNNIDKLLEKPFFKESTMHKLIPYAYHGYDVDGRPIYIERTGQMLCQAIASNKYVTMEELKQSHIWGLENLAVLAYNKSIELGRRIDSFTTIIDMNGLWWHHKDVIPLLGACTEIDNKYYPERIGKLYLINLPWIAPMLYQLVVPLVDPVTKVRIFPLAGDGKDVLTKVVPPESLPKMYGGTCTCEGKNDGLGCVPQYPATDIENTVTATKPDGYSTEKISYEFEKTIECTYSDGGVFTWWFQSHDDYDIDYSITDISDANNPIFIKEPSRCVTSRGAHHCSKPCKLLFKWDNNFSYFYSKTIDYLLSVDKNDLAISKTDNPVDQSAADLEKLSIK